MGSEAIVTGRIEEAWPGNAGIPSIKEQKIELGNRIRLHNAKAIKNFEFSYSDWPPIVPEMFHQLPDHGFLQFKTPLIIFGCSIKDQEDLVAELKIRFEAILTTLYWERVIIDVESVHFGNRKLTWTVANEWRLKMTKLELTPITDWNFSETMVS